MEFDKRPCPIKDIDGVIASGKQFDLDIVLPEDDRNVIYGVVKNCYKEPIKDAVVKLIEVVYDNGKEERRPVSHTFTDEEGEFVFGPLCPNKTYALQIWVDDVRHFKICSKVHHEGKCLRGVKMDKCDCVIEKDKCEHCEEKCEEHCKEHCEKHCEEKCEEKCKEHCEEHCEKHCEK